MPIMSVSEYAKSKGWHHSTVQQKIREGKIREALVRSPGSSRVKIDSEVADFELDCNTDRTAVDAHRLARATTTLRVAPVAPDLTENCQEIAEKLHQVPQPIETIHQLDEEKAQQLVANVSEKCQESVTPPAPERKEETPAAPPEPPAPPLEDKFGRYRDAKTTTEEYRARKLELEVAEAEGRLLDADEVRQKISKLVSESRESLLNVPGRIAPTLVSITDVVEMENKLREEINFALESISRLANG